MRRWPTALLVILCPLAGVAADDTPPAPDLRIPPAEVSEWQLEALAAGDARRAALLVDLTLRLHADAAMLEAEEREASRLALARWRAGFTGPDAGAGSSPPALVTPGADALRAQAVGLAWLAREEATASPELPDALLAGGLAAERLGRSRDALRLLGALLRSFPASRHVADAWLGLGEHYLRDGDLTRARFAFGEAERRGRPSVRAWSATRLAETSLAASDLEGALSALERATAAGSPRALPVLKRIAAASSGLAPGPPLVNRLADLLERAGDVAGARAVRAQRVAARRESSRPGGAPRSARAARN